MGRAATDFASGERASDEAIEAVARAIAGDPLVRAMFEVVEGDILILDHHRQVVAVSPSLLERLGYARPEQILGLRPGELLHCAKVAEGPSGCGTSHACRSCGAALAIVASQRSGQAATSECLLAFGDNGCDAAEYRVRCTPLAVDGHQLTAFVLHDISAEKRRAVLERLFLHDLATAVGSVVGWGSLLAQADVDADAAAQQIVALGRRMAQEIRGHAALVAAESGELQLAPERLQPRAVLREVVAGFRGVRAGEVAIALDEGADDAPFAADADVLGRVLRNMVQNAVEAAPAGGVVRVWHEARACGPTFFVHNAGVMAEPVQHQVFKRSFSTKGRGHGLGTYGMKLFGERYLGGRVGFRSTPADGTTFWIALGGSGPPR